MAQTMTHLTTAADWDRALAESVEHAVLLFWHDESHPVSAVAWHRITASCDSGKMPAPVYYMTPELPAEIGTKIKADLGLKEVHAPHVAVISNKMVSYQADAYGIDPEAIIVMLQS